MTSSGEDGDDKQPAAWRAIRRTDDPKTFLLSVMNNAELDLASRIEAARALMPYYHPPLADDELELEDAIEPATQKCSGAVFHRVAGVPGKTRRVALPGYYTKLQFSVSRVSSQ